MELEYKIFEFDRRDELDGNEIYFYIYRSLSPNAQKLLDYIARKCVRFYDSKSKIYCIRYSNKQLNMLRSELIAAYFELTLVQWRFYTSEICDGVFTKEDYTPLYDFIVYSRLHSKSFSFCLNDYFQSVMKYVYHYKESIDCTESDC